jgi:hypothetical protein
MNKLYASVICASLVGSSFAQGTSMNGGRSLPLARSAQQPLEAPAPAAETGGPRATVIWSNTFSNPSDWSIGHNGPVNVDWQIGVGLTNSGDYPTVPVNSTTQADGYAMVDSDAGNNNSSNYEYAHMTNVDPIDLSDYPNVILTFETFYRRFTDERPFIVVSTNNTDWPTNLTPASDISGMNNVFDVFPGFTQGDVLSNPHHVFINISEAAGGADQVWVRFLWVGIWGYSWFVDDVAILEQPENDMWLNFGYVANNDLGIEYGRIPASNVGSKLYVGGQFTNFGTQVQTNATLTIELSGPGGNVIGTTEESVPAMNSSEVYAMDATIPVGALTPGLYTVTYTLVSDQEQDGDEFENNVIVRRFEVSNEIYGIDFIDVVEEDELLLTSFGTNSFTGNPDGFIVMTAYDVNAPLTVFGLQVMLANGTVAGGLVTGLLLDTVDVLNDPPVLSDAVATSDPYTLTQQDVNNGYVVLPFTASANLSANQYYAAVELVSNNNANDIRVLDDTTVPQPGNAGLIYLPSDNTVYGNGNAFAIRLRLDSDISVGPERELAGVSMFPNPTNGLLNIQITEAGAYTVEVMDLLGARIHTGNIVNNTVLDLSGNARGVYMVRISNERGAKVERITLN